MKLTLNVLAFIFISLLFSLGNELNLSIDIATDEKINWNDNIKKAIKIGKEQNKDVLIYFGMAKCVPCRMIKKYAFTQSEFIDFSKKFVMVKVYDDLDKSNIKNQEYVKKSRAEYGIEAVPTIVLLKNDGTKSSFFAYVKSPKELIEQIESQY